MATLESSTDQIKDKLADLITGPVQGVVSATASATIWVPQGQLGTLPGGRRVRVTKAAQVGTTASPVRVRLEHLSPAYPAAQNFREIAASTVVTWIDPPAELAPTATVVTFGPGVRASGLMIGSLVEAEALPSGTDLFAAGANGTASMVLLTPRVRSIGGESYGYRTYYEATWRLRVALAPLGPQRDRRALSRDIFDALTKSLQGATVGDDDVNFRSWDPVKPDGSAWDLTFTTRFAAEGRSMQPEASADDGDLDEILVDIRIPGDADGEGPFRVQHIFEVP